MLRAPTSTAPGARIRCTRTASSAAGGGSRLIEDPARIGRPVEEVLDCIGHAGERLERAAGRALGVNLSRLGSRSLSCHIGEGVDPTVERRDPGERRLGDVGGAHRAVANRRAMSTALVQAPGSTAGTGRIRSFMAAPDQAGGTPAPARARPRRAARRRVTAA